MLAEIPLGQFMFKDIPYIKYFFIVLSTRSDDGQ
jgi:hypothetical protein